MLTFNVNWLAVVVAVVANMIVGAMWYGPLFGKQWMKEEGLTMEDTQSGNMAGAYGVAILNSFLMAFMLANVMAWTGITGLVSGALLGLFMWLGFTGFAFGANHAFLGHRLPRWFYNACPYLVGLIVQGMILGAWQ